MWIDSEAPMTDIEKAWTHLASVTTVPKWDKPNGAIDEQVLFMTTCMETWLIADRATLKQHYGEKLQETALLSLTDLEKRDRHAVQNAIINATRKCSNAFKKGERSYEVLGKLNPAELNSLPSFARVATILKKKLKA